MLVIVLVDCIGCFHGKTQAVLITCVVCKLASKLHVRCHVSSHANFTSTEVIGFSHKRFRDTSVYTRVKMKLQFSSTVA